MSVWKATRMALSSQYRSSRNLGEGIIYKIKRAFWATLLLFKGLWQAIGAMSREQLGSVVMYRGRRCMVSNWAGSEHPTLSAKDFHEERCPRVEIRNIVNLKELWHRFTFGFTFYMNNWYKIDVQRRVYRYE